MSAILAIDLGKFNSVFCWLDPDGGEVAFRTAKTTPDAVRTELTRQAVGRVVIEACSQAGWVHDLCGELGLACQVANTAGAAWAWKNVKRKTDRDDALKLARLSGLGELPTVAVPPSAVRQRKSLIALRKRLVGQRVRGQNRLRGLFLARGLSAPVGAKAWSAAGLAVFATQARPLPECGPGEVWRGEVHLLLDRHRQVEEDIRRVEAKLDALAKDDPAMALLATVPGLGPRTAEVISTHLGDARRFATADEVSAYAGLVPRQYQSGQTDRRGRITKRGPKLLRAALVECAWCALRYNAWALATWQRLRANGCSKKKAVVALARKLLVRCWGMLRTGQAWREPVGLAGGGAPPV
jgi:transposase